MAELHASDCSIHNGPAYPPGPCDCGADAIVIAVAAEREACAMIAKHEADTWDGKHGRSVGYHIMNAIRARSKD